MARLALLTGFSPFASSPERNPSWLAVSGLQGKTLPAAGMLTLECALLATEFEAARRDVMEWVARLKPDFVIATGVAVQRTALCMERFAVNLMDSQVSDNAGSSPREVPLVVEGPTALSCPWSLRSLQESLQKRGLEVEISNSAGTFVCNAVYYELLRHRVPALFVHVPALPPGEHAERWLERMRTVLLALCQELAKP